MYFIHAYREPEKCINVTSFYRSILEFNTHLTRLHGKVEMNTCEDLLALEISTTFFLEDIKEDFVNHSREGISGYDINNDG